MLLNAYIYTSILLYNCIQKRHSYKSVYNIELTFTAIAGVIGGEVSDVSQRWSLNYRIYETSETLQKGGRGENSKL